jgi:hypothetical protein
MHTDMAKVTQIVLVCTTAFWLEIAHTSQGHARQQLSLSHTHRMGESSIYYTVETRVQAAIIGADYARYLNCSVHHSNNIAASVTVSAATAAPARRASADGTAHKYI